MASTAPHTLGKAARRGGAAPSRRLFCSSAVASSSSSSRRPAPPPSANVDLVGPPDPLSNIRPVLYADAARARSRSSNSPYSASEFPSTGTGAHAEADAALAALELRWRLHRERVDAANHRFWAAANANYAAQLARRLEGVPAPAQGGGAGGGEAAARDEAAREAVLATFYRDWQIGNRAAQRKWVRQWWADVWASIKLQGEVHWARALRRLR